MTQSQQQFLQILSATLWNKPCACTVTDEVFEISVQQSTSGLISSISTDDRCQDQLVVHLWVHSHINEVLCSVVGFLKENGIRSVLMKGQGCAAYYPRPELRSCGDIDLYVGEENYLRTIDLLENSPFDAVVGNECDHHKQVTINGVILEIHHTCICLENKSIQSSFDRISDKGMTENLSVVEINGSEIYTPEDTFNVLYVFVHMLHHFVNGGIGFRQVCDWTMLLHAKKDVLDRDRLREMLDDLKMMDCWRLFGYVVVHYLGLPEEEMPFFRDGYRRRAELVLKRIFLCGNFGHYGSESDLVEKIHSVWLRKPVAFFVYTLSFFRKKYIVRNQLPYSTLFEMYSIGFGGVFHRKNKNN